MGCLSLEVDMSIQSALRYANLEQYEAHYGIDGCNSYPVAIVTDLGKSPLVWESLGELLNKMLTYVILEVSITPIQSHSVQGDFQWNLSELREFVQKRAHLIKTWVDGDRATLLIRSWKSYECTGG